MDIGAHLAVWGVGQDVGDAVGKVAATAVGNVALVPLHFYAAVYGVRGLDATLRAAAKGIVDGKIDTARDFCRERGQDGDEVGRWSEEGDRESGPYLTQELQANSLSQMHQ